MHRAYTRRRLARSAAAAGTALLGPYSYARGAMANARRQAGGAGGDGGRQTVRICQQSKPAWQSGELRLQEHACRSALALTVALWPKGNIIQPSERAPNTEK